MVVKGYWWFLKDSFSFFTILPSQLKVLWSFLDILQVSFRFVWNCKTLEAFFFYLAFFFFLIFVFSRLFKTFCTNSQFLYDSERYRPAFVKIIRYSSKIPPRSFSFVRQCFCRLSIDLFFFQLSSLFHDSLTSTWRCFKILPPPFPQISAFIRLYLFVGVVVGFRCLQANGNQYTMVHYRWGKLTPTRPTFDSRKEKTREANIKK